MQKAAVGKASDYFKKTESTMQKLALKERYNIRDPFDSRRLSAESFSKDLARAKIVEEQAKDKALAELSRIFQPDSFVQYPDKQHQRKEHVLYNSQDEKHLPTKETWFSILSWERVLPVSQPNNL